MEHFNDKILELRKLKKQLIHHETSLNEKKLEEIKNAVNLIQEKYDSKIEAVNLDISKTEEEEIKYNKVVETASIFNRNAIVKVMRDIIRIYEGYNFIYKQINYCPDSKRRIKQERAKVLISSKKNNFIKDDVDISKLYALQKSGDGIILEWNDEFFNKPYIKFYGLTEDNELKINVKLNKFPYLKQYIDFVILYCIKNDCYTKYLSEEKLEKLKIQFINDNVENIQKYHEIVKENEEFEMKKEIENNAKYRAKQLRKALNK